jgi:dTDP-4-amino-4,6-dideoxygalactose transaminase
MRSDFLVFGAPSIGEEEINEVVATLRSGWIGTGPKVARFEEKFRTYKGARHAVALNSCTAALHLSLIAAGVGPGDEVITTAMTFVATVNSILHAGASPVLADIDPHTWNIDPAEIRKKISPRTKALVVVHFAGRPCEMDEISAIAKEYDLILIEDCAHAIETIYHGQPAGTFGTLGCFSFYVTKNIITGEGGLVLTNDEASAARIKVLGLHGMSKDAWKRFGDEGYKHYYVEELGFKYNMTDMQASLGLHQLPRIEGFWQRREAIWNRYQEAFQSLPIGLPAEPAPDTLHAYHLYTVLIDPARCGMTRDAFLVAMLKENIGTGVHYLSIPEHPFYQNRFGWKPEDYPHAAQYGRRTLSLPLSPALSDEDVADVIEAVRHVCEMRVQRTSA